MPCPYQTRDVYISKMLQKFAVLQGLKPGRTVQRFRGG